jgi:hypothetical protein
MQNHKKKKTLKLASRGAYPFAVRSKARIISALHQVKTGSRGSYERMLTEAVI